MTGHVQLLSAKCAFIELVIYLFFPPVYNLQFFNSILNQYLSHSVIIVDGYTSEVLKMLSNSKTNVKSRLYLKK